MQISFSAEAPDLGTPLVQLVRRDGEPANVPAAVSEAVRRGRFAGKPGQVVEAFVERDGGVRQLVLLGIGDGERAQLERAGGAVAAKYLTSGRTELAFDFTGSELDAAGAQALLLGGALRGWRYDVHRTTLKDDQKVSLAGIVAVNAPEGTEAGWGDSGALAEGVAFARELVTEPANVIYPVTFVERCSERFAGTGANVRALGRDEMAELGMGALLGVAQGSAREPQLLVIEWNGGGDEAPLAFVGKGVTFDTGGISLKPPPGMEDMKWDMGGAGAVAGAMLALVKRRAKANIVGICGLVENMPDAEAQRPGDIVTSMSGQTIEVLNTDAEGRLVLCDAMEWVQREYKPARMVDLATLTGAMLIALGHEHGGLFSNDDMLAGQLVEAGEASGDKLWRLPLGAAYDKLIDSPIADIKNVGPREAGSITAAQFLQRFVHDGVAWAHLDIAGMVWGKSHGATWNKGATGYGVRLLDRFVRDTLEG